MRTKTPAERANINARGGVQSARQLSTIKRALREELGDLPVELGTVDFALDAAFKAGYSEAAKALS